MRTFCPFFVFLFVKYLCLPERRLVIGYIYKKEDCDCRYCLYFRRRKCRAVRCCCLEDKVRTRSPVLNENDKEIYEFYTKGKTDMKAIIKRNDQTAVLDLPTSRMELAGSLSRIGVRTPAYIIPCSDEEEDYIKVKLFGESDFENELTALVTPKDSLGSVNTVLDLYRELPRTQKEKLNAELSQNPPDSLSSLCQKVMDFQPKYVTEDYYFPLTVSVCEYNEYGDLDYDSDSELDGRFADNYADEIKAMFDAYTASDDTDMAEYFDGSNSAVAKIKSLKWDFESFDGVLFGRVRATLTEPLTEDEEAELKEFITGQNSDGLGEGAEQQDIRIPDGIMNVHFWNSGDSYFVRNSDEFSEMPHTHGMTMGGM